ncbi:Magnesium-chelatase 38 kDa subunit [Dermatophilus congolensis]|uniref:Magnesium-chelatase 38 kDa subunit n=2 Tax=Dermatophilus congolensis TaxID=1863 RepID=A0AA46H1C5_9MICO|nr:Magnesium-chelatase 38 kDa subunit [Dermatophilus congolensis]
MGGVVFLVRVALVARWASVAWAWAARVRVGGVLEGWLARARARFSRVSVWGGTRRRSGVSSVGVLLRVVWSAAMRCCRSETAAAMSMTAIARACTWVTASALFFPFLPAMGLASLVGAVWGPRWCLGRTGVCVVVLVVSHRRVGAFFQVDSCVCWGFGWVSWTGVGWEDGGVSGVVGGDVSGVFPFSALVGQERMCTALLLVAVAPRVGGVLLRGEKGTAKSTAVRALAALLPGVDGGVAPMRTLPLGVTEDRVVGGLDSEVTMRTGVPSLQPGLLAEVDGGVLYVDEVNLLDDHVADLVLDAAASGVNRVEREGLSLSHPSRFALVGTMNPEEGALRPQVLDRFGLCVEVQAERDPQCRVDLMVARAAFDADPVGFCAGFAQEEELLAARVAAARVAFDGVVVPRDVESHIVGLSQQACVAGHRADVVMADAARALAALEGRSVVSVGDVDVVAEMVLVHRRREVGPPPGVSAEQEGVSQSDSQSDSQPGSQQSQDVPQSQGPLSSVDEGVGGSSSSSSGAGVDGEGAESGEAGGQVAPVVAPVGASFRVKPLAPTQDRLARKGSGRRMRTRSAGRQGRYVRARPAMDRDVSGVGLDVAVDATLRAAAPYQRSRREAAGVGAGVFIRRSDWQVKVRERQVGTCLLFLVDASGSMGARGRMSATKGAVLSLLMDAYQKRDKVALVSFRGQGAQVLLPPTASVERAADLLEEMPTGGRTPLASGLVAAGEVLRPLLIKEPNLRPLVLLISDGRGNVHLDGSRGNGAGEAERVARDLGQDSRVEWIVVDTEPSEASRGRRGIRLGLASRLADALGATCHSVEDLRAEELVSLVRDRL